MKNYVKIIDGVGPFEKRFAFADTKENLADQIFIKHKLFVRFGPEFEKTGEKYKIIFCKVSKKRAGDFVECMKELSNKMELFGYTDYEEFCESLALFFDSSAESS